MAIIGISGKKQSGKDTVGKIIQYLTRDYVYIDYSFEQYFNLDTTKTFQIKKFADKLKDIVCLLINCTREQLEDETFKNTELGPEWWVVENDFGKKMPYIGNENYVKPNSVSRWVVKLTPRLLLQLLGTECGRDIIHPNIWVNSLMSEYKPHKMSEYNPSNWIITDVRFPNEAESIKEKNGLLIRIESPRCNYDDKHPSETALDDYGGIGDEVRTDRWDAVIFNDGTIEELIEKVKKVLIKHKVIKNV